MESQMTQFLTVITPSMMRESLVACCESVDYQTFDGGIQHIVQCDSPDLNLELINRIKHPNREVYCCGVHHKNYGNSCRHNAWEMATGKWLVMLDDDNTLASPQTLKQIAKAVKNEPDFAVFPILRHGHIFFNDPPGLCMSDTGNIVVKREIGRWPDGPEYTMDGIWIDALKAKYQYQAFPDALPIIIMEHSSEGK